MPERDVDRLIEEFERERPTLLRLAHRMLGSMADAEDVVQDVFMRWQIAGEPELERPGAWFTRTCTRLCIDRIRSAKAVKEQSAGESFPEPWVDDGGDRAAALDDSLSFALLLTLQRLTPNERAAFLLHDVFGHSFDDVAGMLELEAANCRQLASRARRHVQQPERERSVPPDLRRRLSDAFFAAVRAGDESGLRDVLTEDVVLRSDGGGKVPATKRPVHGSELVARFLIAVGAGEGPLGRERVATRFNGEVNDILLEHGVVVSAFEFEIRDDQIAAIWVQRDPDKLVRLQVGSSDRR